MDEVVTVLLLALAGPVVLVALALALSAALPGTRPPLRARAPHRLRVPAGGAGGAGGAADLAGGAVRVVRLPASEPVRVLHR